MEPDPYTILVSERDTPILIYYPGTGTWHPIHILSWCRNVTPDPYSILVSERDTSILIYYPVTGTWHSIHILSGCRTRHSDPHILSWYRNVAPDPYTILVSERDTPILIYYPGIGTWHPIHILSWCRNVTLRSLYTILVPERGTRSPNLTTFIHQAFFIPRHHH